MTPDQKPDPDPKGICVGCGKVLWSGPPRDLAVACCCGAMAPVIQWSDGTVSWPASVSANSQRSLPLPHLEYYLGFSNHRSQEKTQVTVLLASLGSASFEDCTEPGCKEKTQRYKERTEERLRRRGQDLNN